VQVLRQDTVAWKRYLRICTLQAVVTVLVAGALTAGLLSTPRLELSTNQGEGLQFHFKSDRGTQQQQAGGAPETTQRQVLVLDGSAVSLRPEDKPPDSSGATTVLAALYGTVLLIQWVVVALSRGYHDAIGRDLSMAAGIEPEDSPFTPRIRVDFKWIRNKIRRRVRAFTAMLPGFITIPIAIGILSFLLRWVAPPLSSTMPFIREALAMAWVCYWWAIFTAAKSARAWVNETTAPLPALFSRLEALTQRFPLLRWFGLGLFVGMSRRMTRPLFAPAARVDQQPLEFAGLAATRALTFIPLVKFFLRPLIPVASARLLVDQGVPWPAPSRDAPAPQRSAEAS
jgi:hypothetical protein